MGLTWISPDSEVVPLLDRARGGDAHAVDDLLSRYRSRLKRMVEIRLDARLLARIDASDVVQDALIDVTKKLSSYLDNPKIPLLIWLRLVVSERLLILHRRHLGAQRRDAGRDVSIFRDSLPAASSAALAEQLLGRHTSPTAAAIRAEQLLRLQDALNSLDAIDREVLSLRHFEQLTRCETAHELGITEAAAAKRYVRALKRLRALLSNLPGGMEWHPDA